ncbi:MAG: Trp family transcriptional regulator, partial [Candidatus Roizmanbacteria bacterium]|nr:Trp family transcriptional regulator [Candidatus Roizmanbacteria bacterium]
MARISKYKLRNEVLDKLFNLFFEIVGNQDDKNKFNEIIKGVFSYNERIMFAKRIAIIYLLLKNIDFQNICMALNVSSSTVAKFKLLIENKHDGFIESFDNIIFRD